MLLHKIRDGRSFEHVRTIDGVVHPTFKAACAALGLRDDDNEWNEALAEASTWASAKKLRSMYCTILMHSETFKSFFGLKEGTPIIFLKSQSSEGLCNGTRLVVTRIGDKVLKAKVITGSNIRDLVLIPHISLTPQSAGTPFPIKRRQFPVKVAFAMTINKSQGQTLKNVGVYLPEPVFAHDVIGLVVSVGSHYQTSINDKTKCDILLLDKRFENDKYAQKLVHGCSHAILQCPKHC
nr:uncharacterized protein LOC113693267 [Coffea arabica]